MAARTDIEYYIQRAFRLYGDDRTDKERKHDSKVILEALQSLPLHIQEQVRIHRFIEAGSHGPVLSMYKVNNPSGQVSLYLAAVHAGIEIKNLDLHWKDLSRKYREQLYTMEVDGLEIISIKD